MPYQNNLFSLSLKNRLIAFDNLTQAKNELKRIKNWRIFDKSQIDDTEKYSAYLLVKLDQTKLPKQLQADITSNQEWQLASKQFPMDIRK
jgi:hypothetical protein